jgi:hypothetical protein
VSRRTPVQRQFGKLTSSLPNCFGFVICSDYLY